MKPGSIHMLEELHRDEDTVAWYVAGLYKEQGFQYEKAHFTVHKGNRPISDFLPALDDDSLEPPSKYNRDRPDETLITRTRSRNLMDVYAYAGKLSSAQDSEIPAMSPATVRVKPGESMTMKLGVTMHWPCLTPRR